MVKTDFTRDGRLVMKGLTDADISSVNLHADKNRYIGIIVNDDHLITQLEEHGFNVVKRNMDLNRSDSILYANIYWSENSEKRHRNPKIAVRHGSSQNRIRTQQDFYELKGVHFDGVDIVARSFTWKDDQGHRGTAVDEMIVTPAREGLLLDFDEGLFDDED